MASKQSTRQAPASIAWMNPTAAGSPAGRPSTLLHMDTVKTASVPDTPPVPARNVPFVPVSPVGG